MTGQRTYGVALTLACAFLAVDAGAQADRGAVIVDHRPSPVPAAKWTAGRTCSVVFGKESPQLPEGLFRVTSATRLSNGTVVVATNSNVSLLYFDPAGTLVARAGGRGGGPGEINGPAVFISPYRGDSVLARGVGPAGNQNSVFGPDGKFGRVFSLTAAAQGTNRGLIVGTSLRDGWTVTLARAATRVQLGQPDLIKRDSITIRVFDAAGAERATIGPIEDVVSARAAPRPATAGSGGRMTVNLQMIVPGRVSRWNGSGANTVAASGGPLYHFEERTDALAIYDFDGTLRRRVLIRPLDAALRPGADNPPTAYIDAQRLDLFSDRAGRAWVEVARERTDGDRKWWVFDAQGKWLAEATTPPITSQLLEIGDTYILLLQTDQNDLETVAYCPIRGM